MSKNWDTFFHYGESDLNEEAVYDIYEILLQTRRSLFYFRRGSAGINEFENNPNGMSLQIMGRFEIANTIAYRNSIVSSGADGSIDRRIAISQNAINFLAKNGSLDINILYFLYGDTETLQNNNFLM